MTETDIIYENGPIWVGATDNPASYTVYRISSSGTHSVAVRGRQLL